MSRQPPYEAYDPQSYRSTNAQNQATGIFSSNRPHRAPVLCYIAGVEAPVTSCTVSFGIGKIPEAQITMFPDPSLQRLGVEDRVPVVCFYLDEFIEPDAPTWRMLFEGEIVGWAFNNTAMGRSIVFSCVGDIAVYTQLFLFYMSTLSSLGLGTQAAVEQKNQINMATATYPYALFKRGLIADGRDKEYITRPFDFAYNIIRGLLTDKIPAQFRGVPAINFFTRWARRQQFQNKWVALPYLDEQHNNEGVAGDQPPGVFPIIRAVQSQTAVDAVERYTTASEAGSSIFDMLRNVLDTVFMELVMLPTASLVSTDLQGNITGPPYITTETGIYIPQSAGTADPQKPSRLANYFIKPQLLFGLPPACNVIFPSMVTQFSYNENYVTQPTRLYFQDDAVANLFGAQGREDLKTYLMTVIARAYPPEADYKFQESIKDQSRSAESGKNLLLYPDEFFKGPVTARYPAPRWLMYLAMQYQGTGRNESSASANAINLFGEGSLTESDLYRMYAQYEYFKQKYAQRGGAVECAFHPYLVPGFPTMIFDSAETQVHVLGYLMNVTHAFSPNGVQTSVNFSYGRTIYEFFNDVANEIEHPTVTERKGYATAAAPPEPIKEIRDIVQHFDKAEKFYQQLFLRRTAKTPSGATSKTQPAVFSYREMLAYVKSDGTLEDIYIEGRNEETIARQTSRIEDYVQAIKKYQSNEFASTLAERLFSKGLTHDDVFNTEPVLEAVIVADTLQNNLDEELDTQPKNIFNTMSAKTIARFLNLPEENPLNAAAVKSALAFWEYYLKVLKTPKTRHNLSSQRPISPKPAYAECFDSYDAAMKYCSRPLCTLEEYIYFIGGIRDGVNDEYSYGTVQGVPSARYYTRIRDLKGLTPKDVPSRAQQGLTGETPQSIAADFPDLRSDWQKTLLAYRRSVYDVLKISR